MAATVKTRFWSGKEFQCFTLWLFSLWWVQRLIYHHAIGLFHSKHLQRLCKKSTGVTNSINDGSVYWKCPSKQRQCASARSGLGTGTSKLNAAALNVNNYTCAFCCSDLRHENVCPRKTHSYKWLWRLRYVSCPWPNLWSQRCLGHHSGRSLMFFFFYFS